MHGGSRTKYYKYFCVRVPLGNGKFREPYLETLMGPAHYMEDVCQQMRESISKEEDKRLKKQWLQRRTEIKAILARMANGSLPVMATQQV